MTPAIEWLETNFQRFAQSDDITSNRIFGLKPDHGCDGFAEDGTFDLIEPEPYCHWSRYDDEDLWKKPYAFPSMTVEAWMSPLGDQDYHNWEDEELEEIANRSPWMPHNWQNA
jgi:hypothetical protein